MMKNKKIKNRKDLYRLIYRIDRKTSEKMTFLGLYSNKQYRQDVLWAKEILKTDRSIKFNIKKKYILGQYFSYVLLVFIPLCMIMLCFMYFRMAAFKGKLNGIFYSFGNAVSGWLFIVSVIIIVIYFWQLSTRKRVEDSFVCLLRWYKENIKNRPEREINQIIQQVHIPWYKKGFAYIFGIWSIFVLKTEVENKKQTIKK
jgi:hypothetical protein